MTLEAVVRGRGERHPQQGVGEAGVGGCQGQVPTYPPYQEEENEAAGACQQRSVKFSLLHFHLQINLLPNIPEKFSHVMSSEFCSCEVHDVTGVREG